VSSFLSPLHEQPHGWILRNRRTQQATAISIETAFDSPSRRRGLLGRVDFPRGAALIIAPCGSIHMFFMRFAIDVIFVARDGRILKACSNVRPWRIAGAWGAFAAIELPAGTVDRTGARRGDYLEIVPGS
jgi:uncharacterized membrane protein (UPF0127 family)